MLGNIFTLLQNFKKSIQSVVFFPRNVKDLEMKVLNF